MIIALIILVWTGICCWVMVKCKQSMDKICMVDHIQNGYILTQIFSLNDQYSIVFQNQKTAIGIKNHWTIDGIKIKDYSLIQICNGCISHVR